MSAQLDGISFHFYCSAIQELDQTYLSRKVISKYLAVSSCLLLTFYVSGPIPAHISNEIPFISVISSVHVVLKWSILEAWLM